MAALVPQKIFTEGLKVVPGDPLGILDVNNVHMSLGNGCYLSEKKFKNSFSFFKLFQY